MSRENVETTRRAYEGFAQGDIDAATDLYDPDVEWIGIGDAVDVGGPVRGKAAVLGDVLARIPELYEDFRIGVEEFLDAGDAVVVLGQWHIRAKGGGSGFDGPHAAVFHYGDDGKVSKVQFFADTAGWLRAGGQR